MVFSSIKFLWVFLPVTVIASACVRPLKLKNLLLLIASLIFYAWGNPVHLPLLIVSILINYAAGRLIDPAEGARRKAYLVLALVLNLGLLGYFKYTMFALRILDRLLPVSLPQVEVALPIGISFFTFQSLSYVIDLYRGQIGVQKNPLDLALYISFFPQLIAGPIVKYREVELALKERSVSLEDFASGFRRFLYGLGKKVLIANQVAMAADTVFDAAVLPALPYAWLGALSYTLQIYYDFSGYSDMAIGLGRMFGFHFNENFDYPYTADSVRHFWRRWHISLSTWFRDYLYIPLGGSRHGTLRTYRNLLIVFALTGLWHGAAFTFVFWGLWHGAFLLAERAGLEKVIARCGPLKYVYTMLVVVCGWVFFRAGSFFKALSFLSCMFVPAASGAEYAFMMPPPVVVAFCAGLLGIGGFQRLIRAGKLKAGRLAGSLAEAACLLVVLMLCILLLTADTYNPFIYYRF